MRNKIDNLVALLNEYTYYYDKGEPKISDKEWDKLYFKLVELQEATKYIPNDSPTNCIKYTIVNNLKKVQHNHLLLSAEKTKSFNEFANWVNLSKSVIMAKCDGLTVSLTYEKGRLIRAETRGNGEIGEDIVHNAYVLSSIPNVISYQDTLIIDGELIIDYETFEKYKNEYKNPRNLVSGTARLLNSAECQKRNPTFIAWRVYEGFPQYKSHFLKLKELLKYGFEVVPLELSSSDNIDILIKYIRQQAKERNIPIDGIVARYDDIEYGESLGKTGHHEKSLYAFKFYDDEYETTLRDIEWTMGRSGVLTPVAIFDTIDIDGSEVSRASLHNLSVLNDILNTPYIGQKIKVFKANMIIPQISWGEPLNIAKDTKILNEPEFCPVCDCETIINDNDGILTLWCSNPSCQGKLINRLDYFVGKKGLDIKGLSIATLEKLIDWGWVESISDIFNLKEHRKEWSLKAGFGEKSVDNILEAIENSRIVSLEALIASLGIPLIGRKVSHEICTKVKTWAEFKELIDTKFNFSTWDGFGEEKTKALLKYNYDEINYLIENSIITIKITEAYNSKIEKNLDGLVFVITGKVLHWKNRAELSADIERKGGKVSSSVTTKTSYLINNDIDSGSSKNIAAKKLEIPIITEEQYLEISKSN